MHRNWITLPLQGAEGGRRYMKRTKMIKTKKLVITRFDVKGERIRGRGRREQGEGGVRAVEDIHSRRVQAVPGNVILA